TKDFTGTTNPRRDLHALFTIIHDDGFKIIVRPGPVIRNEWRNGGYPDYLLERPAYAMPLHDVLDGRYPATATYQNAHADAAAQEWLENATHLQAASAWLHDALSAVAPYANDVIAIALDDDQGAYLDNDTWPAPHWHAYVGWLRARVQETVGTRVPLFINTFDSKVTAAAPAWAWGDWYQSDAFEIGEHDLRELDFATGLLQTQPQLPVMMAEFQAGWLQGADEAIPRPSDPRNTAVALGELLRDGAHGIVNFPVQDTIYPDGWEAPWANWSYAWDAAFAYDLAQAPRYAPTAAFGEEIARYGPLLARTHPAADAAIVWPPSLYEPGSLTNADFARFAGETMAMQQRCERFELTCDLLDARFADESTIARYDAVIMPERPPPALLATMLPGVRARLAALEREHRLWYDVATIPPHRRLRGARDATLLLADDGSYAFVEAVDSSDLPRVLGPMSVRLHDRWIALPKLALAPHSAALLPVNASPAPTVASGVSIPTYPAEPQWTAVPPSAARTFAGSLFGTGDRETFLANAQMRVAFAAGAGARVALLESALQPGNAATSIGLLRDAVDPAATPSARDYIAAYTHPIQAGTFNRHYDCRDASPSPMTAVVTCSYDAPDIPDGGARFERTLTLAAGAHELAVDETFAPHDPASTARLVSISGLAFAQGDTLLAPPGAPFAAVLHGHRLAWIRWNPGEVARAALRATRGAQILTLTFAARHVRFELGVAEAATVEQAMQALRGL
ncbi:MAG TPA: beta-galactosidase, partial [Verrucomicrobiae bacterium]|nr:beta-galactosidase [Verrucomicrobiae bacterium]